MLYIEEKYMDHGYIEDRSLEYWSVYGHLDLGQKRRWKKKQNIWIRMSAYDCVD